jgi:tRNA A37 methylthiotransferase MiaB
MPRTFTILFLGCARRQLDCERIRNCFVANGFRWVPDPAEAEIIVVSTCGLSKQIEDGCLEFIRRALRCDGEVVVYGCLPSMNRTRLEEVYRGKIVTTRQLDRFDEALPGLSVRMSEVPDANRAYAPPPGSPLKALRQRLKRLDLYHPIRLAHMIRRALLPVTSELRRAAPRLLSNGLAALAPPYAIEFNNELFTLRISEGCRGRCSYCAIRRAIGGLRSKSLDELLEELRAGRRSGFRSVNLVSSDTGSWGTDRGQTLPQLLRAILEEDDGLEIRFIQDLHPSWLCRYGPELRELVATGRIRSILTAVQSGSERVLGLMRRPTDLSLYRRTLRELRRAWPRLRLRTQIIVGFPTETEEDFLRTIDLVRECRFQEVDLFTYFETESMASAAIRPKVPPEVARSRLRRLAATVSRSTILHADEGLL